MKLHITAEHQLSLALLLPLLVSGHAYYKISRRKSLWSVWKRENLPGVQEMYHLITSFSSLPPQNNDDCDKENDEGMMLVRAPHQHVLLLTKPSQVKCIFVSVELTQSLFCRYLFLVGWRLVWQVVELVNINSLNITLLAQCVLKFSGDPSCDLTSFSRNKLNLSTMNGIKEKLKCKHNLSNTCNQCSFSQTYMKPQLKCCHPRRQGKAEGKEDYEEIVSCLFCH